MFARIMALLLLVVVASPAFADRRDDQLIAAGIGFFVGRMTAPSAPRNSAPQHYTTVSVIPAGTYVRTCPPGYECVPVRQQLVARQPVRTFPYEGARCIARTYGRLGTMHNVGGEWGCVPD